MKGDEKSLVSRDEYFKIAELVNEVISKIASFSKIDIEGLRWYHIKAYADKIDNLEIFPYEFSESTSKALSGFVKNCSGVYLLSYNTNQEINSGRQHFTFCHEFYHYLFHFDGTSGNLSFSDLIHKDQYSQDESPKEIEANIGASLFLINDFALLRLLDCNYSFSQLCSRFEVSYSCMWNRLMDYLTFKLELNWDVSFKIVNAYRYNDSPFLRLLVLHYGDISSWVCLNGTVTKENVGELCESLGVEYHNSYYYRLHYLVRDFHQTLDV
ncbi:ImmA/IrrE family metallo-endopeptidase [Listeria grandensis]|uniref:ImmA/IrrE family metallo-endopeptidase n=1 Tax=Listeria grandensis TaxID=1494963 RepID=UPI001623D4E4|nr:ImmA/IrrE family metallo-endopeptidase [Listeria grandensis]MBC1474951.1 ImmA/IrrE family metallo-endopeptidase [Listeria grandensis]